MLLGQAAAEQQLQTFMDPHANGRYGRTSAIPQQKCICRPIYTHFNSGELALRRQWHARCCGQ